MRFVELYNNNNKLSLILSVSLFLCGTDISAEMPPIDRRRESLSSGQVFCPILVSISLGVSKWRGDQMVYFLHNLSLCLSYRRRFVS